MLEQFLDALDGVACAVDADARIVAVGRRRWDRFVAENGAPELRADSIIGRSLFDFISGSDIKDAYRRRFNEVIATGEPAIIPLRCDSPGMGRELRMSIGPLRFQDGSSGLLFHAQIVSETLRPPLDVFDFKALLGALKQRADMPIVSVCSFCQRLRRPGSSDAEDWISAEEYHRLGETSHVRVSHALCADCEAVRFSESG